VRLPLRHPPPGADALPRRCAHLEALARGLVGVPLGPAAKFTSSSQSRGRHGSALQWHLGLAAHDSEAVPDWEGRIEIKLVSVWRRPGGEVGCDKLKVCDAGVDPWTKLANVLWVFADRLTRIVVAQRLWTLAGPAREALERAWQADPHFGDPSLFVEAREQTAADGTVRRAPAYYLSNRWLASAGLLPPPGPGIFPFDATWWREVRAEHRRDPIAHVRVGAGLELGAQTCRRCGGPLTFDPDRFADQGWAPARHGMPMRGDCAVRGHFILDPSGLVAPAELEAPRLLEILEERDAPGQVFRVCDQVAEPDDHLH